jgi:recombinational DNA repair protein (RecF pathway)
MAKVTSLKENQQVYVLHTYPFKETSLIVEIFSKEFGRVSLVAKGARTTKVSIKRDVAVISSLGSFLVWYWRIKNAAWN